MSKSITLAECAARLLAADNILVLTHARPDGDTLGSAAALVEALRAAGKVAFVCKNEEASPKLAPFVRKYFAPEDFEPGLVCSVDVAGEHLFTAAMREKFAGRVELAIDHHGTNDGFAAESCVDAGAAACAEMIVDLTHELGVKLTPEAATPAYLGIATDTGCFRFSSTSARTHRAAAECIAAGIDFYAINRDFFEVRSRAAMAIESAILSAAEFFRGGTVAVGRLTLGDIARAKANSDDTDNISSILRSIEGVELGVLLREYAGEWRVSARSMPGLSAAAICARLGGGGHECAAGATLRMGYDEAREAVFEAIRAELGEL